VAIAEKTVSEFAQVEDFSDADPLDWAEEFTVTATEVAEYGDPEWIRRNLIIAGHLVVLAADPGAGKTTICTHLANNLARQYRVMYVLADIGQTDVKHYHDMAEQYGWTLLLPDLKVGLSMADVVKRLEEMNTLGGDFSDVVLFCDTLKKMADVINKRSIKELLILLRSLTAKGMTIVLLAHTNKYKDADGDPIFEGTHDIKTDCDDLIYLIPYENEDKSLTTSTKPSNKVRGTFEPVSFTIKDRLVEELDEHIDTQAISDARAQFANDADDIDKIIEAIRRGKHKQTEILATVKEQQLSKNKALRILRSYTQYEPIKVWNVKRAFEKNAKLYYLRGKE
jgi:archaellum biogenesis ATPase FlaH